MAESGRGNVTVTIDHSAVEMQERERADKIEKEFNEYKASIEAEKAERLEQEKLDAEEKAKAQLPKPKGIASPTAMSGQKTSKYPVFADDDGAGVAKFLYKNSHSSNPDPYLVELENKLICKAYNEMSNSHESWELGSSVADLCANKGFFVKSKSSPDTDSEDASIERSFGK